MDKSRLAIIIVLISTVLVSIAQLMYKFGMPKLDFGLLSQGDYLGFLLNSIILNFYLLTGFALYGISVIMLLYSLRHGKLSTLYPLYALNFVWVNLLSMIFLNETVTLTEWAGSAFIVLGVSLVGSADKVRK